MLISTANIAITRPDIYDALPVLRYLGNAKQTTKGPLSRQQERNVTTPRVHNGVLALTIGMCTEDGLHLLPSGSLSSGCGKGLEPLDASKDMPGVELAVVVVLISCATCQREQATITTTTIPPPTLHPRYRLILSGSRPFSLSPSLVGFFFP